MTNELQTKLDAIKLDKDTNLKPENLKAGITCLGVNGTYTNDATAQEKDIIQGKIAYSSGKKIVGNLYAAKLFNNVEEMNTYKDATDGDLAMVYSGGIGPVRDAQHVKVFILRKNIELSNEVTDNYFMDFGDMDNGVRLMIDNSRIDINFEGASYESYSYSSSDGKNYELNDYENDVIITNYEITLTSDYSEWNDIVGEILYTKIGNFGGLFEYVDNITDTKKYYLQKLNTLTYNFDGTTISNMNVDITDLVLIDYDKLKRIRNNIPDLVKSDEYSSTSVFYIGDKLCMSDANHVGNPVIDTDGNIVGTTGYSVYDTPSSSETAKIYEIDLENETGILLKEVGVVANAYGAYWDGLITSTTARYVHQDAFYRQYFDEDNTNLYMCNITSSNRIEANCEKGDCYGVKAEYQPAPTQFTLQYKHELLPGISAYGSEEVIGDETVYDYIPKSIILTKWFGLSKKYDYTKYGTNYELYSTPTKYISSEIEPAKLYKLRKSNENKQVFIGEIVDSIHTNDDWYDEIIAYSTDKTKCLYNDKVMNIATNEELLAITNHNSNVEYIGYKNKVLYFNNSDYTLHIINLDEVTDTSISSTFNGCSSFSVLRLNEHEMLCAISWWWHTQYYVYVDIETNTVNTLDSVDISSHQYPSTHCTASIFKTTEGNIYIFDSIDYDYWMYKYNTETKALTKLWQKRSSFKLFTVKSNAAIEDNGIVYFVNYYSGSSSINTVNVSTGEISNTKWNHENRQLICSAIDGNIYIYTGAWIYELVSYNLNNYTLEISLLSRMPVDVLILDNNVYLNHIGNILTDVNTHILFGYVEDVFKIKCYATNYLEINGMDNSYEIVEENPEISVINTVINPKSPLNGWCGSNLLILQEMK